jgi:acyl carrier protein
MTRDELILIFESNLEEPPQSGSLTGDECCRDLDGWNSLAVLAFISEINKGYGITLPPTKLFACEKVNDVIDLVTQQIVLDPGVTPR